MANENQNSNPDVPEFLRGATEVEYDDLGRLVMAVFPHGHCVTWQYFGEECEARSAPASKSPGTACPDCRGAGTVVLLTSRSPCKRCGGTGYGQ